MANIYVRSTDGSDADNGSTWALAKATLAGAAAVASAGDTVWVSQAHAETAGSAKTITFAGTLASPIKVLCGNDAAEPPTALSTSATVTTTATSSSITVAGSIYVYGITFRCTTGSSSINLNNTAPHIQRFESCGFDITSTSTNCNVSLSLSGTSAANESHFANCTVGLARTTGQTISAVGKIRYTGGAISNSAGFSSTQLILSNQGSGESGDVVFSGVDLSGCGTSGVLMGTPAGTGSAGSFVLRNCKLATSWAGSLCSSSFNYPGFRAQMHNCDSADTNYRIWEEDWAGSIKQETTIVRSGGASDGTTSLSWKMASSANAEYPVVVLESPEIVQWNDTTGSAITVTVEVITDNVTLNDDECWLEVQYLGTSGYPLSVFIDDCKADVLATAANQATSTETWTTTGLTTPTKQKLSVTFTPQEKGFLHAVVKLAKASTTVYVDPLLVVT